MFPRKKSISTVGVAESYLKKTNEQSQLLDSINEITQLLAELAEQDNFKKPAQSRLGKLFSALPKITPEKPYFKSNEVAEKLARLKATFVIRERAYRDSADRNPIYVSQYIEQLRSDAQDFGALSMGSDAKDLTEAMRLEIKGVLDSIIILCNNITNYSQPYAETGYQAPTPRKNS